MPNPIVRSSLARAGALLACAALWGCAETRVATVPADLREGPLEVVATTQQQVTGIAVSRTGRVFLNFPRWIGEVSPSVAEVDGSGGLKPYPDEAWNRWDGKPESAREHLVCVQSVWAEGDSLWILDPASPQMAGVVPGGAKLVRVNLDSNAVTRVYPFDAQTAPQKSYLNDLRFTPDLSHAFITDSGLGALVVMDVRTGRSRRLLENDPRLKAEPDARIVVEGRPVRNAEGGTPQVHADGIAMDPRGEFLYLHALTGTKLYRVPVAALLDEALPSEQLAAKVEQVSVTPPADGMLTDAQGNVLVTDLEHNAVVTVPRGGGQPTQLFSDPRLLWPDSLAMDAQGRVYVTASQIHRMPWFLGGKDERRTPYLVLRFTPR